ncbi:ALP1-like protein [Tanacetum coccineum]
MVLNSPCFTVKSWLVHDQTVPGKDKSNPLIVDSLPKTIRFSIHLVVYNEELAIPEQTANGKGTSNPLMAVCVELSILATTLNRLERSILNWDLQVILEQARMVDGNPSQTPVDTESKLGADGDPVSGLTLYHSLPERESKFLFLDAMARDLLSVQASMVASESAFFAYAAVPDSLDEYLQIGEKTSRDCLMHFCNGVIELYGEEYLRRPTQTDVEKLYAFHENKHGFPGMIGSIDCTKWSWAQCPQAYRAQFSRGDSGSEPFILLEAVASQDLWIWHAFFGVAGSNNDVNVLRQSPVLNDLKVGKAPEVPVVAKTDYKWGYYLTDGIYPEWAVLMKSISQPGSNDVKRIRYKQAHEAARKDVERAFGVLKKKWAIVRTHARKSNIRNDAMESKKDINDALNGDVRVGVAIHLNLHAAKERNKDNTCENSVDSNSMATANANPRFVSTTANTYVHVNSVNMNSYANIVGNNGNELDKNLFFVPTGLNDNGEEAVIFAEELVIEGSKKWQLTLCGYSNSLFSFGDYGIMDWDLDFDAVLVVCGVERYVYGAAPVTLPAFDTHPYRLSLPWKPSEHPLIAGMSDLDVDMHALLHLHPQLMFRFEDISSLDPPKLTPVIDEPTLLVTLPSPYLVVLGDEKIDLLLRDDLDTLLTGDREINFNHCRDIEKLERLLANDHVPVPMVFDQPLSNSYSMSRPIKTSDLILEELTTKIVLVDSISTNIDDRYYDSEGDTLYFEQLLNEDSSSDLSPALLPTESSLLVPPLPDPKQLSLREVERFDSFFSLTQSGGKTRVMETPSFGFHRMPSPLPTAYSSNEVMYRYYNPHLTSGDGFDHGPKMK